jgi:hypothetical protein
MGSAKKLRSFVIFAAAGLALFVGMAQSAYAVSPSAGATITGHGAAKDGTGIVFANGNDDVGWKVWVSTDASARQVTDELGNPAVAGIVRMVCVSSGATTDYAVLYDSASVSGLTTANQATNVGEELLPAINRSSASLYACSSAVFVQFWQGLVVLQSGITGIGTTHVYWRPARGGSN